MTKFLTNIDLAQNQLKNAVIHNLSAAPQNPVNGQIYYNTTDNKFYLFSNDSWETFSTLSEISEKYYNKEQIDEIIETSATLPNQENNSGKALVTDGNDVSWENIIELNNVTLATREGLPKLVINKLTQAEYDALEAAGLINEKELYLTENDPSDNPGASLPDQTNNAGKALVTDGTDVSWQHIVNMNNITESTSGGLASININKLTQAEYDELLENGQINENELYVITDPKEIISKEEISEQITEEVSEQLSSLTIPTKTSELTNDSGFITEVPSEYITETELDAKGYLTEHQNINHKADLSYVNDMLADKANVVSTYTKDEVNELLENIDVSGATLPDQTNMSGKVLVSDGENASWTNIIQLNNITESTNLPLSNLVINQLTQEEYDNLLANGLIKDDELYITDGNNGGGATGDVPTKLSELENDTGFITSNDLPIALSQLENDSGFITEVPSEYITETELDAKGYLTEHQDISGKADKETTYTKEEVDTLLENIDVSGATLPNQENNSGKALVTNGSEASWENIIELNNVTQSTVEGLPKLVINRLTQEEYNELLANGLVKEDEIYITNGSGGSGSGESLPDQTNNGGKVLTTDGSEASWQHIISMNNTAEGTSAGLAALVINKVTQAEYDELLANDQINDNELYTITDGDGTYASTEYVDEQISNINVPTKTSELENDSGFITEHQDISGKADKETTYTKEEVDTLIPDISTKQDILTPGNGITIIDNVISSTGGSGASLPDQSDNAGKVLTTNGEEASWNHIINMNDVSTSTTEGVSNLVINKLTQAEYDELVANNQINYNEFYAITDANMSFVTEDELDTKADKETTYTKEEVDELINNIEVGGDSGASLPDQTNNSGKALVTDGTDAKWDYIVNINNVSTSETAGISSLVINRVTQAEYDEMLANDQIKDNELYTIIDAESPTINDIETIITSKQPQSHIITLSSSEWASQGTTISLRKEVSSLLSTDIVWVSPLATTDSSNETVYVENNIRAVTQEDGFLTFYCNILPTTDVNVQLIIQHV